MTSKHWYFLSHYSLCVFSSTHDLSVILNEFTLKEKLKTNFRFSDVYFSRNLFPFSNYTVAVASHGYTENFNFEIGVRTNSNPFYFSQIKYYIQSMVEPFTTKVLTIPIEELTRDTYIVYIKGIGDEYETIYYEQNISFTYWVYSIFIQIDKPQYKPGESIKFRALFLDRKLKAYNPNAPININLYDPQGSLVKTIKDVHLVTGVYSGEFNIKMNSTTGVWKIVVSVRDGNDWIQDNSEEKEFVIADNIERQFSVNIDGARDVAFERDRLTVAIKAKYTNGKDLNAKLIVNAYISDQYDTTKVQSTPVASKTYQINGKEIVDFSMSELGLTSLYELQRNVVIEAIVQNNITNETNFDSITITIHKKKYAFNFMGRDEYKPHMPYRAKISVTNADGTPVKYQRTNKLSLTVQNAQQYIGVVEPFGDQRKRFGYNFIDNNNIDFSKTFTLDLNENGETKFEFIPPFNYFFLQITLKYDEIDSGAFIIFDRERDISTISYKKNFIQISVKTSKPELWSRVEADVFSSYPLNYLSWVVIGRGSVVAGGTIQANNQTNLTLSIPTTFDMVPNAFIFIYNYNDGYYAYDGAYFSIYDFNNQLNLAFSKLEIEPNQKITIKIETNPQSYVGLIGIDQSDLKYRRANEFDSKTMLDWIVSL